MKNLMEMEIEKDIKELLPALSTDELNKLLVYVRGVRNDLIVSDGKDMRGAS